MSSSRVGNNPIAATLAPGKNTRARTFERKGGPLFRKTKSGLRLGRSLFW